LTNLVGNAMKAENAHNSTFIPARARLAEDPWATIKGFADRESPQSRAATLGI